MKPKTKITVLVVVVLTVMLLGPSAVASQDSMLYGTIDVDIIAELTNELTSSGTTTPSNGGETIWYDMNQFIFDYEMLFGMMRGPDGEPNEGPPPVAALSAIKTLNTIMKMRSQDPAQEPEGPGSISDIIIIEGDLAGSQMFLKVLRDVQLSGGSTYYEFLPGIITGKTITVSVNETTLANTGGLPSDFPDNLLTFTIPSDFPAVLSPEPARVLDNLTHWEMIDNMNDKEGEGDPMNRILGPFFSPVLDDNAASWTQNGEFYEDMISNIGVEDPGFRGEVEYDVTSSSTGLSVDVNITHVTEDINFNITQRIKAEWTSANGGWLESLYVEMTPVDASGTGSPLLLAELNYASTEAPLAVGVRTGDSGTYKTGTLALDVDVTGDFALMLPSELTQIESELATMSNEPIVDYSIGDFDGMFYGINIDHMYFDNQPPPTGAQEPEPGGPPDNMVINSWDGGLYVNMSHFPMEFSWSEAPAILEVENKAGIIKFPLNMSELSLYDWTWMKNWTTIYGVILDSDFRHDLPYPNDPANVTDQVASGAKNWYNDTGDTFDGESIVLNNCTGLENGSYRVVVFYEDVETAYHTFWGFQHGQDGKDPLPVLMEVDSSGTGMVTLPDFAPKFGLDIIGVFLHDNYDWGKPPEDQTTTNYWTTTSIFDGKNITIPGITPTVLAEGLHHVTVVVRFTPLEGHGMYMPMMMNGEGPSSNEDPQPIAGAQDEGPGGPMDLFGGLFMSGLISPAIVPDWDFHKKSAVAANAVGNDVASSYNSLIDYFLDQVTSTNILHDPEVFVDFSATWLDVPPTLEVEGSIYVFAGLEGNLLDSSWPFKEDTNITLDLYVTASEEWTSSGLASNMNLGLSLSLASEKPEETTTTTTTTTTVQFSPGFEILAAVASTFAIAIPIVVRRRKR
ncbi:MAG: hypothetical protein ACXAEU_18530 [Candidatus Hodarchaeales archaeon]|jgi:hypothetical protein